MKTVSELLAYLESQGHGVTARDLREAIEAEKRVTAADLEKLREMLADMKRADETIAKANALIGETEVKPKRVYWHVRSSIHGLSMVDDDEEVVRDYASSIRRRADPGARLIKVTVYDGAARKADIERRVATAPTEERKRLQRAVAELHAKAVKANRGIVACYDVLEAMGAIHHVDAERNVTQWIDRETGDVVHERRGL